MTQSEKYYLKIGKAADLKDFKDRFLYRCFEILPGALSLATLGVLIFLSSWRPVWMAFFTIAFDIYWLVRTIYFSSHLKAAFDKMREAMQNDWADRLNIFKDWQKIYQLVILPMFEEDPKIIESTLDALVDSDWPKDKMIVVLATEEKVMDYIQKITGGIRKKFNNYFGYFLVTTHPQNIKGEISGKGSNAAFAARQVLKEVIDKHAIPYEEVIVSIFDIDTKVPKQYFVRLTYQYLIDPKPLRASYQPVPVYNNNIWEAPILARVMSYSATFWHMMQQERPDKGTTFSSHSMSLKALVDVDFWQTNVVSEDSRIFFQCLLHYDGDYRVVPLYYPVSMDANVARTFWQTMVNQYKQQRRWAWGVENIPYILFAFLKNKKISLQKKIHYIFYIAEGFWSWATNSIIIFMMGWLPLLIGGKAFNLTLLSYNLPRLTQTVLFFSMIGIVLSVMLTIFLMPPKPLHLKKISWLWIILQWFLIPVILIVFGSIPALDAQLHLMLGRYMGFWVTEKARKKI